MTPPPSTPSAAPGRPRPYAPRCLLALLALAAACGATHPAAGSRHRAPPGTTAPTTAATTTAATTTSTAAVPTPAGTASWTTYGGSFGRTSVNASFPAVTGTPTKLWTSPSLDGGVYGEPLLFDGQVFVATENDTVYALSATTGKVQWSVHLATPVSAAVLPCGDIGPTVGITSTMVIDPDRDTIYASAETGSGGAVGHEVFGISLATHTVVWSRGVDQPGWTAAAQLQRIALGISDGRVLVAFGGNEGDCGNYHGWLLGVPETGTGPVLAYEVPTRREGAIWAPAGVTVDASGDIFVATGNGSAGPGQPFDHGDAVIELSPTLSELSFFAPADWARDNADDGDLGSTSPVLLQNGQLFEVGKETTAYLLNADALGGIGGQVASLAVCPSLGANAYQAPDLYVVCPGAGAIAQVRIGPGATMTRGWTWTSPTGGASSPTLAGGVIWVIDLRASLLYGIGQASGDTRFSVPLDVGTLEHFAAPTAAGGMVVVAGSSAVEAFG